jgi:hemolysin III
VAIIGLPQLWDRAGAMAVALLATGGVLYTVGAVIYARRRPDPSPRVFGYHEIFHVLVIAAAAVHFAAIAFYAV